MSRISGRLFPFLTPWELTLFLKLAKRPPRAAAAARVDKMIVEGATS